MMKSDKDKTLDRRLLQAAKDFPKFVIVDPVGNILFEVNREDYEIFSMDGTKIDVKIKWQKPSQISMSS